MQLKGLAVDARLIKLAVALVVVASALWFTGAVSSAAACDEVPPDQRKAQAVAVDSAGNRYVAGHTTLPLPGQEQVGGRDAFLEKYDPEGNRRWVRQFGTARWDQALHLAVDAEDNVYVIGQTMGAFEGETHAGRKDIFIRQYRPAGGVGWTRQFGGPDDDFPEDVAVDDAGDVYLVGYTWGPVANQPDPDPGGADVIVARYTGDGEADWVQLVGGKNNEYGLALAVLGEGEVYVAGSVYRFDKGDLDAFVTLLDDNGEPLWNEQFGTADYDYLSDLVMDPCGNLYLSGYTVGSFPGQSNAGGYDAFIRHLDRDGQEVWTHQLGMPAGERANTLTLDNRGRLYLDALVLGELPRLTYQVATIDCIMQ